MSTFYRPLPDPFRGVSRWRNRRFPFRSGGEVRRGFVDQFFGSESEYREYVQEFEHGMMFEYELVYGWLDRGGTILSDDITWNDAFSVFTNVRDPNWRKLSSDVGYIVKPDRSSR